MKLEDAYKFTDACINGEPASCSAVCPFNLDLRSFLSKASRAKWSLAYKQLRNALIFPAVVSALCDAPCHAACQRPLLGDGPINIREIENACIRLAKNKKQDIYSIPPKNKKVAVIGAGTAGLSCAVALALKKFDVTVFDKESAWGGSLRSHPLFLDFDRDFHLQFDGLNVMFSFNSHITDLDELLLTFDAVYIASGSGAVSFSLLHSWNPSLHSTSNPAVFLGGSLCGQSKIEGIAAAIPASTSIEVFLQTGKPPVLPAQLSPKSACTHILDHSSTPSAAAIPCPPGGFSDSDAKAEAARCMQCDCSQCINACEMLRHFKKLPRRISIESYTDTQAVSLASRNITRQTYSCTNCGYCKSICPQDVNLGALFMLSRNARSAAGINPAALHDYWLREMDFANSDAAFSSPLMGNSQCEFLFFPGCQLGAYNPAHVTAAFDFLSEHFNTAIMLSCCGAPAFWAGDSQKLSDNINAISRNLQLLANPTVVYACATCASIISAFLPDTRLISIYQLISEYRSPSLPFLAFSDAAVFDPCSARDLHEIQSAVRKIASDATVLTSELPDKNRCCGHGGLIKTANPSLFDSISSSRVSASDKPYIVYCANCKSVFDSHNKSCAHILDIAFNLTPAVNSPPISHRRSNSLKVKAYMMNKIQNLDFIPEPLPWDSLSLHISPEVRSDMEAQLISENDVREAIWNAEHSGIRFSNGSDFICSMEKPILTYWVRYRPDNDAFLVLDAYYHRMRIGGGDNG